MNNDSNKKKLTLLGVFALAISGVAPTGSMAYGSAATAKVAGINIPLSFLLGGLGILCVAASFASMAKYVSAAGSAYAYNRKAFGECGGFITGWILTLAYLVLLVPQPGLTANFINVFLKHFKMSISISLFAFIVIGVFWLISLFGIKFTSKVALITEAIALVVLLILSAVILLKGGAKGINIKPFIPHNNFGGIGQGMIFAVLSYSGFEEVSAVSIRTDNPKKTIPKTLILTVLLIAIFYIVVTAVTVWGFGENNIATFAGSASPLDYLSAKYLGEPMAIVMDLAILLSAIASVLGCGNACAYMIYALGQHHYLPSKLGEFDYHINSPKNAVNLTALLAAIGYAVFGVPFGYQSIYSNANVLGVLGLLIVYILVCVGNFVYFEKNSEIHFSIWSHAIVPLIGVLILIFPFISNIYPVPKFPANLYPYIIVAWVVLGLILYYIHSHKSLNE